MPTWLLAIVGVLIALALILGVIWVSVAAERRRKLDAVLAPRSGDYDNTGSLPGTGYGGGDIGGGHAGGGIDG